MSDKRSFSEMWAGVYLASAHTHEGHEMFHWTKQEAAILFEKADQAIADRDARIAELEKKDCLNLKSYPDTKLKPCPFCSGEAEIEQFGDNRESTIVACTDCGCRLETCESYNHGQRWNTRAEKGEL